MEVILREDYPSLGYVGDRVSVRRGYARNYLLPRGIAVEVSSSNARLLNHKLQEIAARRRKKKAEAEEFSKRFLGLTLEFTLKANQHGRVFGSVSPRDIEEALLSKGIEIDRKQIRLAEPIRAGGTHEIVVKLHSEVSVPFKVAIEISKPEKKEPKPRKDSRRKLAESAEEDDDFSDETASVESQDDDVADDVEAGDDI